MVAIKSLSLVVIGLASFTAAAGDALDPRMDYKDRAGSKFGGGGVSSHSSSNADRRERLRKLVLEPVETVTETVTEVVTGKNDESKDGTSKRDAQDPFLNVIIEDGDENHKLSRRDGVDADTQAVIDRIQSQGPMDPTWVAVGPAGLARRGSHVDGDKRPRRDGVDADNQAVIDRIQSQGSMDSIFSPEGIILRGSQVDGDENPELSRRIDADNQAVIDRIQSQGSMDSTFSPAGIILRGSQVFRRQIAARGKE